MIQNIIEKNLVDYLTGKKVFFPVFVDTKGLNKVFNTSKTGVIDVKLFLTESSALRWCKEQNIKPTGLVKYDIILEPTNYLKLTNNKIKELINIDERPKQQPIKSISKSPIISLDARTTKEPRKRGRRTTIQSVLPVKVKTRVRRTKEEIAKGLDLATVIKLRKA